jgi:hypothetical protein
MAREENKHLHAESGETHSQVLNVGADNSRVQTTQKESTI